jgi:hypothetical protein
MKNIFGEKIKSNKCKICKKKKALHIKLKICLKCSENKMIKNNKIDSASSFLAKQIMILGSEK